MYVVYDLLVVVGWVECLLVGCFVGIVLMCVLKCIGCLVG